MMNDTIQGEQIAPIETMHGQVSLYDQIGTISTRVYIIDRERNRFTHNLQTFRAQRWDDKATVFFKVLEEDMQVMFESLIRRDAERIAYAKNTQNIDDFLSRGIVFMPCIITGVIDPAQNYLNGRLLVSRGVKGRVPIIREEMGVPGLQIVEEKYKDGKPVGYIMESEYAGIDAQGRRKQFFLPYRSGYDAESVYHGKVIDALHNKRPAVKIIHTFKKDDEMHKKNLSILEQITSGSEIMPGIERKYWWNAPGVLRPS